MPAVLNIRIFDLDAGRLMQVTAQVQSFIRYAVFWSA